MVGGVSLISSLWEESFSPGDAGKMRGAGALHCAPGRATRPQRSRLCIRSRSVMHTPVDVTGIEPAKASLQNLGLPNLLGAHPTILF